ncbi:MAG: helix-turn-helix transcriptional regulator [Gallionellaceae bacterium]|nr:helix-turn-helix transcriptional regulator [Gallionellaceae bacterium]
MSIIAQRLRLAREQLGLGQAEAASKFGIPISTYRKYESGPSEPGADAVAGISRAGINANWLLTGEGKMLLTEVSSARAEYQVDPTLDNDYVSIPLYDVHAAAGGGALVDAEHVVDVLHFKQEWIRAELRASPDDLYLIHVDGESMEPTLRPGDIILVDKRDHSQARDGIYVLRMNGTLLVKRLQRLPGGVIKVTSDNAAYSPFEINASNADDGFAIIGRVVWSGRRM